MMKKYIAILFLAASFTLTGCIKDINPSGMTIAIGASEITKSLQKEFPFEQKTKYGKVVLKDPKALLQKGSDRITAGTTVLFSNALIPEQKAAVYVSGKPYFDASSGNIYLYEPSIEKLDANGYQLTNLVKGTIKNAITPVINEFFKKYPIYKVNRSSVKGSLVKSVRVEDGSLLLTLGI